MNIKDIPMDERPIEKGISMGIATLSNSELIAILLGSGTREKSAIGLAEEIIASDKAGIGYLSELTPEELMEFSGVGEKKAARIAAAVELGKRISTKPKGKKIRIENASEIAELFMDELRNEKKEHFKAILLNIKSEIISIEDISLGGLTNTSAHPREAFNMAVKKSAAAVIFCHNHPSGDPEESEDDILLTKRLFSAGKILGIEVLDHIIIGDGVYRSLRRYLEDY